VAPGSRWSSPRSLKYSDDFILLEVAFISGRPKETRLALLKELNASHKNLLCDIGASGPASAGATQEKIMALCAKIFAAS